MNNLQWIINELITSVKQYIDTNKEVFEFMEANRQASTVSKTEAKDSSTEQAPSTPVSSDTAVTAVVTPTETATSTSTEGLTFTWMAKTAAMTAVTFVAPGYMNLKSDKVSRAQKFLTAMERERDSIGSMHDREDVQSKLLALKALVTKEKDAIQLILEDHKKPAAKYDALLRIFDKMLDCMLHEKFIKTLCVSLRFHEVTGQTRQGRDIKFTPPITQAKDLADFYVRSILELQLDGVRDSENIASPYTRIVTEEISADIVRHFGWQVKALEEANNMYVIALNSDSGVAPSAQPMRLRMAFNIASSTCTEMAEIKAATDTRFFSNPKITEILAKVSKCRAELKYKLVDIERNDVTTKPAYSLA